MNTKELLDNIEKLGNNSNFLTFEELVDELKTICNDFAIKVHCQSTFIIDKKTDFLAEVFSNDTSFFAAANRRFNKNAIITYYILK